MLHRRCRQIDLREEAVDRGAVDADAVEGGDAVVGLPGVDAVVLVAVLMGVVVGLGMGAGEQKRAGFEKGWGVGAGDLEGLGGTVAEVAAEEITHGYWNFGGALDVWLAGMG